MAEFELKMPVSGQITTFAEIPKPIRRSFSRYISKNYGMHVQTAYGKIRFSRIQKWEWDGIEKCIKDFLGRELPENLDSFFDEIPCKWELMRFMAQRSMCERTAFLRFSRMDFKPWELKGIKHIWEEFIAQNEHLKK